MLCCRFFPFDYSILNHFAEEGCAALATEGIIFKVMDVLESHQEESGEYL